MPKPPLPYDETLLDELARAFAMAALDRLLAESEAEADQAQQIEDSNRGQ